MRPSNTIVVSSKYIEEKEQQIKRLQEQLDEAKTENNNLLNDIVDLNLTIQHKEEQLNEANDCINSAQISLRGYMLKINEYKKKWGVK